MPDNCPANAFSSTAAIVASAEIAVVAAAAGICVA